MFQYNMLRDTDIEPLGDGLLNVLEKVGIWCQNREMLEAMEQNGATVDYAAEKVTFPRRLCEELLETVRREAKAGEPAPNGQFSAPSPPGVGGQVAQLFYDYAKGERRNGTRADLIEMVKLGSTLHPESAVGHALVLTDVPPILEPLEAALVLAEYAHKPGRTFAWNVRQVDYLREMGEILGEQDWFSWGAICFAHPLRFDKDVADKFVPRAKLGLPIGLTAMPVAGVSTPIAVAGFIAVAGAELVATWLAARALNPNVPLGGSIWAGAADMRTGQVSFCSFDAMHYGFALAEFMRKWSGKTITVGGGEYCDAKEPGYYAALEKAYKAMTIAAFTGRHPGVGSGMLEEGKTLCPEQLMLEREMAAGVGFYGRTVEVAPQTMALDSIAEVGFGIGRSHLDTDTTLRHFRDYLWCPALMDRAGWNGAATDRVVLERMSAKVRELIASYEKPAVDTDKLAKMREVLERARKELLTPR
ncbi:MAG: trimethylamine methyltransferase family protein [Kiritimatiellae bacterium]|nr:trimethylamine methyltransferase family protein [Kiritimatiellia bacterium]